MYHSAYPLNTSSRTKRMCRCAFAVDKRVTGHGTASLSFQLKLQWTCRGV